jgi:hypothetical protein
LQYNRTSAKANEYKTYGGIFQNLVAKPHRERAKDALVTVVCLDDAVMNVADSNIRQARTIEEADVVNIIRAVGRIWCSCNLLVIWRKRRLQHLLASPEIGVPEKGSDGIPDVVTK